MPPKKRQGSMKSIVPSQVSSGTKDDDHCKIRFSDTKILVIVESISGFEGAAKGKGKQDVKYPFEMNLRVALGEEVLGVSESYIIPDREKFDLNYNVIYLLPENPSLILASQPLSIAMLSPSGKDKKKSSSRGTRTSTSKQTSKTPSFNPPENQLLEATVDLLPLIFGEKEVEQRIGDALEILVRLDGAKLKIPSNLLYVTVLSLRNPPGDLISSDVNGVTVSVRFLKPHEEGDETEEEDWSTLKYGPGVLTSSELEGDGLTKRWFSVQTGPPVLSQYRNIPDEDRLRDSRKLSYDSNKGTICISWNQIKRVFLDAQQQNKVMHDLIDNSEWLLEIYVKNGKKGDDKKKGKGVVGDASRVMDEVPLNALYLVRLDMAELLHPGVNCCKVVGHLEPKQRVNLDFSPSPSFASPVSRTSQLTSNGSTLSKVFYDNGETNRRDFKVRDFYGRPSYITVLVELYSSFRPRKTTDQLLHSVGEFVREGVEVCPREADVSSPYLAKAKYRTCLLDNISYLNQLHQEYIKSKTDLSICKRLSKDETFRSELEKSGALDLVKRSLHDGVTSLLKGTSCDLQSGLCEAYCKVVEETQAVLNQTARIEEPGPHIRATSQELLFAAREAAEENQYQESQDFLFKRMHYYGKRDADKWRDLAVINLRHNDFYRAKQSLLTGLCIEPRHRDSLLMLAVMLAMEDKYSDASLMFEALTTFYPRFYKGWFTYSCFFYSIENVQGSDVCLSLGSISLGDKERYEGELMPTFWSPDMVSTESDGFILTAIYLLALNLIQFAEMCLSHHRLEVGQDTVAYLYYLSVAHHLQNRFSQSNSHLKQALSISWNDERLWNLMGHNLYRLGDWDKTVDCYQLVIDEPDPAPLYSLTFYRLGRIMLERGDNENATRYFLKSVCLSPSLKSWIGLAKSSYWAGQWEDSELAAREANRLDEAATEPWACLALVNLRTASNPSLARHCLSLANKCGEVEEDLTNEINKLLDGYGEVATYV